MPNAFFKSWSPLPLRAQGSSMEAAACSLCSCLRSQCILRPRANDDDVCLHRPVHHLCRSGPLRKCKSLRVLYAISAWIAQSVRQRCSLRRKLARSHAACLIAGLATALPDRASEYSVGSIKTSLIDILFTAWQEKVAASGLPYGFEKEYLQLRAPPERDPDAHALRIGKSTKGSS